MAISVSLKLGPFFREGVPPNEKVLVNLGVWVCISEGRQNAKKGSYVAVFLLVLISNDRVRRPCDLHCD